MTTRCVTCNPNKLLATTLDWWTVIGGKAKEQTPPREPSLPFQRHVARSEVLNKQGSWRGRYWIRARLPVEVS